MPGNDAAAYSSIIVTEAAGVKQYVQFLAKVVVGIEAKTGKFLWRYDRTAQNSPANIPSPVEHDGYVYSATGRGGGGLVHLVAANGGVTAEPVYAETKLPTAIGGTVLLDGNPTAIGRQSLYLPRFQDRRDHMAGSQYRRGLGGGGRWLPLSPWGEWRGGAREGDPGGLSGEGTLYARGCPGSRCGQGLGLSGAVLTGGQ